MDWGRGARTWSVAGGVDWGRGLWALPGCKNLGCGLEGWTEGVDWEHGLGSGLPGGLEGGLVRGVARGVAKGMAGVWLGARPEAWQ